MRIWVIRYVIVEVLLAAVQLVAAEPPKPPETRIEVVTDRMHGIDIPDPYRWLEDQQSPETRAWISWTSVTVWAFVRNCFLTKVSMSTSVPFLHRVLANNFEG